MTTPKEALTYISNARWNENADLDDICTMADRALASLEGDAVERVALAAEQVNKWPPLKMALWGIVTGENLNDGHYINAYDLTDKLYAAILATGLVAGEASKGRRLQASGALRQRIEAYWKASGHKSKIEAAYIKGDGYVRVEWSDRSESGSFHVSPELLFATDESAIRADEREKCAKVAEGEIYKERYRTWPWWKHDADTIGNRDNESDLVKHCDAIAAAIRSGGGDR